MSSTPQAAEHLSAPVRSESVKMGNQDFVSVLLRSIGAELYKIWRRPMSRVLLLIAIPLMIIAFVFVSIPTIIYINTPAENFLIPCSFKASNSPSAGALPCKQADAPTQAELNQAQQYKQAQIQQASSSLRLPTSINVSVAIINYVGLIILIILAATIVGGEYGVGTIRLLLTRGPTRAQYFLAKIGAILVCTVIVLLVLTIIGVITGALLNLMSGIAIDFSFLTATWTLHAVLFLLAAILGLLIFTMLALCLSTLGKATAAGLTGALVWWFVEGVIGTVLTLVGTLNKGQVGDILKAIPDYFIGNNITALLDNQGRYLTSGQPSTISDMHALLVLAAYLVVFIGGAWIVHYRRDVTN